MDWRVRWEKDIPESDHLELTKLLRRTCEEEFPDHAGIYEGARSWPGIRPELRVTAHDDDGVAAHICMLRRFLRIGDAEQLVAEIGLVTVRRDLRRTGIGLDAGKRILAVLHELKVPFAFGTVRPEVLHFYTATGSHVVRGARVRSFDHTHPWRSCFDDSVALITPIAASVEEWPPGDVIDRNGEIL